MAEVSVSTAAPPAARRNVADRLAEAAGRAPQQVAVACARNGGKFATITFADLDADATRIARGLLQWGVRPGMRLALLVRPGIEFVTLVFALLRAGAVIVFVDPGLGWRNLVRCLAEAEPDGFIAMPLAQAARLGVRKRFPRATWNVTVGRRWFWGGATLDDVRRRGERPASRTASCPLSPAPSPDDPAAVIFTSGSTGPPKGVLYTHRMFDTQVAEIQATYDLRPGGVDLSCFPLFGLFNAAMGVTTVFPQMDFARPALADPRKLLAAANDWRATQAFASPAVWRKLGEHCARTGERIDSLREIFSCGATVPADVLRSTLAIAAPGARMHTPYGATECLPVASIEAAEVLAETAARTAEGAGVCVGRKFDSIEWRVIRISDEPIATIADAEPLPPGQIGELIVRGPQASPRYVTRAEWNLDAKIAPSEATQPTPWHRMGDVGYLDAMGRFWYCGRKSQRVVTSVGTIYTECCEALLNRHPAVRRSALVGIGPRGHQKPVMIVETTGSWTNEVRRELTRTLQAAHLVDTEVDVVVADRPLPVDVRHNAKIHREQLAAWAARRSGSK